MSRLHPATRLALLQVLVIFVGLGCTIFVLKINGYPEEQEDWDGLALAMRNGGLLLLAIPLVWTILGVRLENKSDSWWSLRWTLASGALILAGLAVLLTWTTFHPYHFHPSPLRAVGNS